MPTKQPDLAQIRQRLTARRHDLTHRQRRGDEIQAARLDAVLYAVTCARCASD